MGRADHGSDVRDPDPVDDFLCNERNEKERFFISGMKIFSRNDFFYQVGYFSFIIKIIIFDSQ